jgi:hypothetical protein
MTNASRVSKLGPVTLANLIMLGLGVLAFVLGAVLIMRGGGSDAAVYVRRIVGTMLGALGLVLVIFAIGLSNVRSASNA